MLRYAHFLQKSSNLTGRSNRVVILWIHKLDVTDIRNPRHPVRFLLLPPPPPPASPLSKHN